MTIWAIADLHLAFGNPSKSMEVFGPAWKDYPEKVESHWRELVKERDLVLIPGDISWAMKPDDALPDLQWIDRLPGEKLLIRGNHDYWWSSKAKIENILPPSLHIIHNSAYEWNGVAFGGARLWDTSGYTFEPYIEFVPNPYAKKKTETELAKEKEDAEKIFNRELERLRLSLAQMNQNAKTKIALVHYPPVDANLNPSRASAIIEEFGIDICVFGHLHNVRPHSLPFGKARNIHYLFASADYIDFRPLKVL